MLGVLLGNPSSPLWTAATIGRGEARRAGKLIFFRQRKVMSSCTHVHNIQLFQCMADNQTLSSAGRGAIYRNLAT